VHGDRTQGAWRVFRRRDLPKWGAESKKKEKRKESEQPGQDVHGSRQGWPEGVQESAERARKSISQMARVKPETYRQSDFGGDRR